MARKTALVCDSTADFPPGMAEQLGLHILPVHIFVNGRDHLHGENISNSDVIRGLRKKRDVYTAPFYPYECAELYDDLLQQYDDVVSFHLSTELSGNYKSACTARQLLFEEDARRVHVIDLGAVSVSLGLVVRQATAMLRSGVPAAALEKHIAPYRQNVFMSFTVENLIWLKKGGRVNAFEAFVGNMLDIKPIIHLESARLMPIEKHRGKKPALKRLVSMAEENYRRFKGNCDVWLAYADNMEEVLVTREKLAEKIDRKPEDLRLVEVGATISVHTGPGSVCVAMAGR